MRSKTWALAALGLAAVALVIACARDEESDDVVSRERPVVPLDSGRVVVRSGAGPAELSVEIAETDEQRRIGLMERAEVPDGEGMLFTWDVDQKAEAGFWMFRTRVPLDVAFIDAAGSIVAIRRMQPCASKYAQGCPLYTAGAPFRWALEVGAGWFERHGVAAGDRVELSR